MSPITNHRIGPTDRRRAATCVAAFFAVFGALTAVVWHRQGPVALDTALLHGYTADHTTALFNLASHVTEIASPGAVIGLGLAIAALVWRRRHDTARALICLAAPIGAGALEVTLKILVHRERPTTAMLTGESGNGFPSGHAAGFTALAFAVALTSTHTGARRRATTAVALSVSIVLAATRVIVGAHYPTDVIGGLLLGIAVAATAAMARPIAQHAVQPFDALRSRLSTDRQVDKQRSDPLG